MSYVQMQAHYFAQIAAAATDSATRARQRFDAAEKAARDAWRATPLLSLKYMFGTPWWYTFYGDYKDKYPELDELKRLHKLMSLAITAQEASIGSVMVSADDAELIRKWRKLCTPGSTD